MKKITFWYTILYYDLIPLLLFGFILTTFRNYIYDTICTILSLNRQNDLKYILYITLFGIWLYISFTTIRDKRYKKLTGRNYQKDKREFHKTYSALVQFFSSNDPYKMDLSVLPIEDWKDTEGIILAKFKDNQGNYRLIKRDSGANGNLISFGLPGSGKSTTQAATTASRFNSHLKDGGCGVFAISIKGDLLNFVGDQRTNIKVFTPDKEEGSCHFDPLLGISHMSWTERRVFAENLSIIICPDESGDNASFFVSGARNYLSGIILYLLHVHDCEERPGQLKFPEIIDTILQNSVFEITMTIHNCINKIPGEYTNGYIGSSEKNVAGIWSHLCKSIRPFNNGAIRTLFDGEGDCITPDDLNIGDIYIDVPQDKYDIYAPCMSIIISTFLQAFMRRPDVSSSEEVIPILFLLDEAPQLNLDFNILSKAMSTLRSKKVSLFLLMQSVAQLESRYGESHAREIIDLCAYVSIFNAQDPKSREYFQKLIGRRKMLKRSTSLSSSGRKKDRSSGITISETYEYIFEAADFGDFNLKDKKTKKTIHRVLIYANGKYLLAETTPCYV